MKGSNLKQLLLTVGLMGAAGILQAAPVTYTFSGTTQTTMTVNNGTNTGSIPAGTPFHGSFTMDPAQASTPVAFSGGSRTTYTYSSMSLTVNGGTTTWGPGPIDLYYHLTSNANGFPIGDSFYVNYPATSSSATPPGGLINGAAFNWMLLGMVDTTGTAFTSAALPSNLNFASFQQSFIEFNYGTGGTPFGAGNTSMIQMLANLVNTSAVPPTITTTSLPGGVYGVPYTAAVTATAPNGDPVTLAVNGLPMGLSFNGTSIIGTPGAVGNSNVTITATDTVTKLSSSSTLPLAIADAKITFTPTLAAGVVNSPYSSTFAAATGGTGNFTYSAIGLPAGLSISGNTVSGTPSAAGTVTVTLTAMDSSGAAVSVPVTLTITAPVPVSCSGTNGVVSAYVARNPGYIVVNGGLNLLDHLWTSNLNATNTIFLGGLVNWFQTGLIVSWNGYVDPSGCILNNLTVAPAVTITTPSLASGTTGQPYSAPVAVAWGVAPYKTTISGLPGGLSYNGTNITGTPSSAGAFNVAITAIDAVGATTSKILTLTINPPAGNYTIQDESKGKISAIAPDYSYLMVGTKKLIWNSSTSILVNTGGPDLHVVNSFVQLGMKVQWKGLRDAATNTVLTSQLEIN